MSNIDVLYWIIKTSLIGSALALLIFLMKLLFRKRLTPSFHYYIWLLLIIKLIVPYGVESKISLYNLIALDNRTQAENISVNKINTNELANSIQNYSIKIADKPSNNENEKTVSSAIETKNANKPDYNNILFYLWVSGVILGAAYMFIGTIKVKDILKSKLNYDYEKVSEVLRDCRSVLGLKHSIRIVITDKTDSPSLIGIFKPTIILPLNIIQKLSEKELKYIILHELSHLKRKDIILSWIIQLLKIAYWFNPIIIFSLNKMQKDCEVCCDASVLSYLGEEENKSYGNTIINILGLINKNAWLPGTTSIILNKSDLKRRMKMIAGYNKASVKTSAAGLVVVAVVAAVGLTGKASNNKIKIASAPVKSVSEIKSEAAVDKIPEITDQGVIIKLTRISGADEYYLTAHDINMFVKDLSGYSTTAIYVNDFRIGQDTSISDSKTQTNVIMIGDNNISAKNDIVIKVVGVKRVLYDSISFHSFFSVINNKLKLGYNFQYEMFDDTPGEKVLINNDYKAILDSSDMVELIKITYNYDKNPGKEVYNSERLDRFIDNFKNKKADKFRFSRIISDNGKVSVNQVIDLVFDGKNLILVGYGLDTDKAYLVADSPIYLDRIVKQDNGVTVRYGIHKDKNETDDMGAGLTSFMIKEMRNLPVKLDN